MKGKKRFILYLNGGTDKDVKSPKTRYPAGNKRQLSADVRQ